MVYNWTEYILWWWGNIWEPLNLTVTTSRLDATITWEDNEIWTIPPTTFQKSELVRKIGSAPTSPSDWDLVVTETVKDTYKVSGYVDQWLTDWETYYYRVFSYSDLGGISYCDAVSVTPSTQWQPWVNTLVYWEFNWNLDDSSGKGVTLSWTPYWYSTGVIWQALQNTDNVSLVSSLQESQIFSWAFTIAFCANMQNTNTLQRIFWWIDLSPIWGIDVQYEFYNDFSWFQVFINRLETRIAFPMAQPNIGEWKSLVLTGDWVNQLELYIDGVKTTPYNNYNTPFPYPSPNYALYISGRDSSNILLDGVIIENRYWTQTDVDLYLDLYPIS